MRTTAPRSGTKGLGPGPGSSPDPGNGTYRTFAGTPGWSVPASTITHSFIGMRLCDGRMPPADTIENPMKFYFYTEGTHTRTHTHIYIYIYIYFVFIFTCVCGPSMIYLIRCYVPSGKAVGPQAFQRSGEMMGNGCSFVLFLRSAPSCISCCFKLTSVRSWMLLVFLSFRVSSGFRGFSSIFKYLRGFCSDFGSQVVGGLDGPGLCDCPTLPPHAGNLFGSCFPLFLGGLGVVCVVYYRI